MVEYRLVSPIHYSTPFVDERTDGLYLKLVDSYQSILNIYLHPEFLSLTNTFDYLYNNKRSQSWWVIVTEMIDWSIVIAWAFIIRGIINVIDHLSIFFLSPLPSSPHLLLTWLLIGVDFCYLFPFVFDWWGITLLNLVAVIHLKILGVFEWTFCRSAYFLGACCCNYSIVWRRRRSSNFCSWLEEALAFLSSQHWMDDFIWDDLRDFVHARFEICDEGCRWLTLTVDGWISRVIRRRNTIEEKHTIREELQTSEGYVSCLVVICGEGYRWWKRFKLLE